MITTVEQSWGARFCAGGGGGGVRLERGYTCNQNNGRCHSNGTKQKPKGTNVHTACEYGQRVKRTERKKEGPNGRLARQKRQLPLLPVVRVLVRVVQTTHFAQVSLVVFMHQFR